MGVRQALRSDGPDDRLKSSPGTVEIDLERAARLIKNKKVSSDLMTGEDLMRAAWPTAVGRIIARHTSHIRLVREKLIVEVEDAIWQRQLHGLSRHILASLNRVTGGCPVQQLEFRIGVPRRQPQSSATRESGQLSPLVQPRRNEARDEADDICDPVMKRIYRLSRRKATA